MNKNVIVLDESGNEIGATYFKRARGLVKKGRARFVSESSIRLTPVPEHKEGDKMSEENKTEAMAAASDTIEEMAAQVLTAGNDASGEAQISAEEQAEGRDSAEYCLKQIEEIRLQTAYLDEAIAGVRELSDTEEGKSRAEALADMIRCRETTNQQLITFYEKMYDERKGISAQEMLDAKRSMTEKSLETIGTLGMEGFNAEFTKDLFNSVQDTIRRFEI